RGETPAAFAGRCILAGCVAPRSNTPGILGRRASPARRLARLGATPAFHYGLLGLQIEPVDPAVQRAPADPELSRRLRLVAGGVAQRAHDLLALGGREEQVRGAVARRGVDGDG